jgi:dienelactone hydrolase
MSRLTVRLACLLAPLALQHLVFSAQLTLPGTQPLTMQGDLSAQMVAGIHRFLDAETERSVAGRQSLWRRDFTSREAYEKSVQPNRARLRRYIGAVDERLPVAALEYVSTTSMSARIAETERFTVFAVRWPVFEGVHGEGLLLQPKGMIRAHVVAIPDADQTPEQIAGLAAGLNAEAQFARRLAEKGVQVVVPVLIDRRDEWSGSERLGRFTNQPHREWIYRQAYEMGRHLIGYEVQKVLALVDWFEAEAGKQRAAAQTPRIGVAGSAEGGLIAFYAAALDTRISAALVSGYFNARQRVWEEPIYRNVFALLHEFGDAEIASLIAPRALIIEQSPAPTTEGPPAPRQGRAGAAPGKWSTPDFNTVETEFNRARGLCGEVFQSSLMLLHGNEGMAIGPASNRALGALLKSLGVSDAAPKPPGPDPVDLRAGFDPGQRQHRQLKELEEHNQRLLRFSEYHREGAFWSQIKSKTPADWNTARKSFQDQFRNEVIGWFSNARSSLNPRSRLFRETDKWTGYEVVLDVWPEVFAWGYLLLPKDLKPGERRPVVVCQHGLEGVPDSVIDEDQAGRAWRAYKAYAVQLAERGFITFAPHNPYRGDDQFRSLQRKLNPLKKTLFSVIVPQHEQILDWLTAQPFVDPGRIGFYGLSYGGKSAMRIPALEDRYALSICSADFNEWIKKNVSVDWRGCYVFTKEYEMFEFDLGHTFNYAEMAALIAPRPFMVERGHDDGVAPDEWVAYEFAKVRRFYDRLGIGDRTTIEFFNGPHTIHGAGTFEFLHRHLEWPNPGTR